MTTAKKKELSKREGRELTDEEAVDIYLGDIQTKAETKEGWENLDEGTQVALIDLAYNGGLGIFEWDAVEEGIKSGSKEDIGAGFLKATTTQGKTSKGLAKRRANQYNKLKPDAPITRVVLKTDGTIVYYDAEGDVVAGVAPKSGREIHSTSTPGEVFADRELSSIRPQDRNK